MRGYPLLQLLLVACLFAAAGLPVWRLTRPAVAPASTPAASATPTPGGEVPLEVRVTFSTAPADFRLSYVGTAFLQGRGPQTEFQGTLRATLPPEGVDLALEASFSANTGPAAVRVQCRFPDGHAADKTFWGDADHPLVELVTITP